ncbi:MAG: hypothetical protein IKQ35_04760 [Bacilli bacterium]|nr:hypothetical protein [Bacilli bacterium]
MINIPYLELQLYLMDYLNKTSTNFTNEELNRVKELSLDSIGLFNHFNKIDSKILKYFNNLEILEISNTNIDKDYIDNLLSLNNLKSLSFTNCNITNLGILSKLKITKLIINNCTINNILDVTRFKHLNTIGLINMSIDSISFLEQLPHLLEIDLSFSNISNISALYHFTLIDTLRLDNSSIIDLDFINKYSALKTISISEAQYQKNKALIDDLVSLKIIVYKDSIICLNDLVV